MKTATQHYDVRIILFMFWLSTGFGSAQNLFAPIQAGDTAGFNAALQAGADINAADEYGQTPLMYAVTLNQSEMVEALIAAGANVNVRTLAGWTALHYAARDATDGRTIDALLLGGANPTTRNQAGETPHDMATTLGNQAAANVFQAAEQLAFANAEVRADLPTAWPRLLGTFWTGPQAVLDHPLCTEAGCRYLRAEPFEYEGTLRWTTHAFSVQQPPGVTLELSVNGPAQKTRPNRIGLVGGTIADTSQYPVRTASAFIADIVRGESQGTVVIDVVHVCVDAPDVRNSYYSLTTRDIAGFIFDCTSVRANVLTGQRLPSPTFLFTLIHPLE